VFEWFFVVAVVFMKLYVTHIDFIVLWYQLATQI
jgi:hypothetical protein